jgi:hypothetical protein
MIMFTMVVVMVMVTIVVSGGSDGYSVKFEETLTGSHNGQCETQLQCSITK